MFGRTRLTNVREKLLGIVTECWEVGELTAREFETAKWLINVSEGEEGIDALNNVDDPLLVERLQMERKLEYLLDEAEDVRKLYEHTVQAAEQKLEELAERLSVLRERYTEEVEAYRHWWARFYGYGTGYWKVDRAICPWQDSFVKRVARPLERFGRQQRRKNGSEK